MTFLELTAGVFVGMTLSQILIGLINYGVYKYQKKKTEAKMKELQEKFKDMNVASMDDNISDIADLFKEKKSDDPTRH